MKVEEVMSPRVVSVHPETPVTEAIRLMLQDDISGLPVLDAERRLVGIVTEGDFLRRAETGTERRRGRWLEFLVGPGGFAEDYVRSRGRKVGEVMTRDVIATEPEAPLDSVVEVMERRRIKRLPVVREGRVVGMVSRADLLRALARLVPAPAPIASGDAEIRERVLAEIRSQRWNPGATLRVEVKDGGVDLWGVLFDEREREALKVAAENVPGVKAVRDHMVWVEPVSGMMTSAPADS